MMGGADGYDRLLWQVAILVALVGLRGRFGVRWLMPVLATGALVALWMVSEQADEAYVPPLLFIIVAMVAATTWLNAVLPTGLRLLAVLPFLIGVPWLLAHPELTLITPPDPATGRTAIPTPPSDPESLAATFHELIPQIVIICAIGTAIALFWARATARRQRSRSDERDWL